MKKIAMYLFNISLLFPATAFVACGQQEVKAGDRHVVSETELETLMQRPASLQGYFSNQSGALTKVDSAGNETTDSTFTVEKIIVPSEGFNIAGWLYLPLGEGPFPLIVLTNGGGDDSRPIRSLSDWIAPILAHCGYAALVHDKRGTGESGGDYAKTTYNDYITDAANCAVFLSNDKRIDPARIGVMGGSEGGRVAVIAASRCPAISFVISTMGTVVTTEEDRWYATVGGFKERGISDSLTKLVEPIWRNSFAAWAANTPKAFETSSREIKAAREIHNRNVLPCPKEEMDSIPYFRVFLPTWYTMPNDYLTELGHFNKPWLAIFGALDNTVPTEASVKNITHFMSLSGNDDYTIAVLPDCGHAPVSVVTKRMIRIDNLVLNWLEGNIKDVQSNQR